MNLISKYLQDTKIQTGLSERFLKSGVNMNMGVFQSNVLELMRSTPDLSKATPESVVAACLAATMMGLKFDKNQGQAYVIPYYNKKTDSTVAQLQIGWRGYKSLAIQSGKYKRIGVTECMTLMMMRRFISVCMLLSHPSKAVTIKSLVMWQLMS